MLQTIKNIRLLFKNFINFFKKNIMQLFSLLFLVVIMIVIAFGSFISSVDINHQLGLLLKNNHWSTLNYSAETDIDNPNWANQFQQQDVGPYLDSKNILYNFFNGSVNSDYSVTEFVPKYDKKVELHSFLPIIKNDEWAAKNSPVKKTNPIGLSDATFAVVQLTPGEIQSYNTAHTYAPIANHDNDPLYALVVYDNTTAHQFNLMNSDNNKKDTSAFLEMNLAETNPAYKDVQVILFHDVFRYFSTDGTNSDFNNSFKWYFNKPLTLAQYHADYFENFNNPDDNFPITITDPQGQQHTWTPNNTDPIFNQKQYYFDTLQQQINGQVASNIITNNTSFNAYITRIKALWRDATVGSSLTKLYQEHYSVANDIEHENRIIFLPANDGTYGPAYEKWLKTGYKNDATKMYHLTHNQVLISHSYAIANKLKPGNKIKLYGLSEEYTIAGFTTDYILGQIIGLSVNNSGYGVWMNPDDYSDIFIKHNGPVPPQSTSSVSYVADSVDAPGLNNYLSYPMQLQLTRLVSGDSCWLTWDSSPNKPYGNIYYATKTRLNVINSLIITSTMLLFISSIVLSFIIINKIIKANIQVIGALKAMGFRTRYMVTTFILVFGVIFTIASIIGTFVSYGFAAILNNSYQIGIDLFDYGVNFQWLPSVLSFFVVPLVMIPVIWILTFIRCYRSSLDLMRQKDSKRFKNYILNWKFLRSIPFKYKISYRFASTAWVKILLTLFISVIASAIFYTTITSTAIFSQTQGPINDLHFSYMYQFNKGMDKIVNPPKDPLELLKIKNMNSEDFVDSDTLKTDKDQYMQISFTYDDQGVPTIDPGVLPWLRAHQSVKDTWIKATDITKLHQYCSKNDASCRDKFAIYPAAYQFLMSLYTQNKYYIDLLNANNGIVTMGTQAYTNTIDNFGYGRWLQGIKFNTNNDLYDYLVGKVSLKGPKVSYNTYSIKDYEDTHNTVNNIYINPFAGSASALMQAKTRTQIINALPSNLKNIAQNMERSLMKYNEYALSNNLVHYKINWVPIYMNNYTADKAGLKVGDFLIDDHQKVQNFHVSTADPQWLQKTNVINVEIIAGLSRTITFSFNYANYYAMNNAAITYMGYNPFSLNDTDQFQLINTDYSADNSNYAKKFLGIYMPNNDYNPNDYFLTSQWHDSKMVSNYKIYLTYLVNKAMMASALNSTINLLFIVLIIISVIMMVACFIQVMVTSNMILKDNINTVNLFRCSGYSNWWIINRLFTVYIPTIIISIFIALPVGITISDTMFKVFTTATLMLYSTSISYFNAFICLVIILILFVIGFAITWRSITKKYRIYQFQA